MKKYQWHIRWFGEGWMGSQIEVELNKSGKEGWEIYQINEAKHGGKRGGEAYTKVYFRK